MIATCDCCNHRWISDHVSWAGKKGRKKGRKERRLTFSCCRTEVMLPNSAGRQKMSQASQDMTGMDPARSFRTERSDYTHPSIHYPSIPYKRLKFLFHSRPQKSAPCCLCCYWLVFLINNQVVHERSFGTLKLNEAIMSNWWGRADAHHLLLLAR